MDNLLRTIIPMGMKGTRPVLLLLAVLVFVAADGRGGGFSSSGGRGTILLKRQVRQVDISPSRDCSGSVAAILIEVFRLEAALNA